MPTVYDPEDLRSGGGGGGGGDAFERAASSSSSLSLLLLSLALSRSRRRVLKNKGNNKFQWKNSSGKIPVEKFQWKNSIEKIPVEKFQWNVLHWNAIFQWNIFHWNVFHWNFLPSKNSSGIHRTHSYKYYISLAFWKGMNQHNYSTNLKQRHYTIW